MQGTTIKVANVKITQPTRASRRIQRPVTINPYWVHENEKDIVDLEAYRRAEAVYESVYKYPEIESVHEKLRTVAELLDNLILSPREQVYSRIINDVLIEMEREFITYYEFGLPVLD